MPTSSQKQRRRRLLENVSAEGDTSRDVSGAEYRAKVAKAVRTDSAVFLDGTTRPQSGALGERIALYDIIEGSWTSPITREAARLVMNSLVDKCSLCTFTSAGVGKKSTLVTQHISAASQNARIHEDAKIEFGSDNTSPFSYCTACGSQWRSRMSAGREHLERIRESFETHKPGAQVVVMRRFSEFPPVTEKSVTTGTLAIVPQVVDEYVIQASGEERSQRKRRRKRSRGHKRGTDRG